VDDAGHLAKGREHLTQRTPGEIWTVDHRPERLELASIHPGTLAERALGVSISRHPKSVPIDIGATGSTEEAHGHLQVTLPNAGLHRGQNVFERLSARRERLAVGSAVESRSSGRGYGIGLAGWIAAGPAGVYFTTIPTPNETARDLARAVRAGRQPRGIRPFPTRTFT
jgi:hypothetical protein